MKGEWRIATNYVAGDYVYAVYRLLDTQLPDHSGNREYASEWFDSKGEAQAALDRMKRIKNNGERNII